jgi:hypothetical protein
MIISFDYNLVNDFLGLSVSVYFHFVPIAGKMYPSEYIVNTLELDIKS